MKRIFAVLALATFPLAAVADDAATLYKSKCAMCHGATGAGDTPMGKKIAVKPLGSPEVQKKTDADLLNVIAKGRAKMPAFAAKLSEEQIKQLVKVIRGFAKK